MTNKHTIIVEIDISKCKHNDEVFNYCDQSYLGEGGLLKNTKNPKRCDCSPNCYYKQLKRKEQECEELKKELQAQRDFTAHEQKLIYCVAYDETCKTGNDCKQEKCIFKDNIKLKQTLTEIIRFFEEDEKFARYSGRPIIFAKPALEKIEKILKENDIKIS